MSYLTILLIFVICSVLAVVISAPLIYIARKLRRQRTEQTKASFGKRITVTQALPGLLLVVVMFLAFAHQYIAPNSWLGSRVSTGEGRFWFSLLAFLFFCVMNYLWAFFKRRKLASTQSSDDS